jgi:hypothetical protein
VLYADGKGQRRYSERVVSARANGEVGIGLHILTPQSPNSRIGFKGKRVPKCDRALIVEKLLKAALKDPTLAKYAANAMMFAAGCKER